MAFGACPAPFLLESNYPPTGGDVDSRICQTVPAGFSGETVSCCLPCLQGTWYYSDSIIDFTNRCQWLNVVGFIAIGLLLVSFAVLPTEKTRRHYLSTCLILSILIFNLGYVVPQAKKPNPCYNDITAHDFHTDSTCFATAVFNIGGGWAIVMWVLLRSLALHLQICWQLTTGITFFFIAQFAGWVFPVVMTVAAFVVSGATYQVTGSCTIRGNHYDVAIFWGPIMAFAVLTALIQAATCLYCTRIFLKAVFEDRPPTEHSSLPNYAPSSQSRTTGASARQAYRRMIRVMQLQWRSIVFVLVLISDVILFSACNIAQGRKTSIVVKNPSLATDWVLCIVANKGNKNACLDKTGPIAIAPSATAAQYFMLGITGWWTLILLGRFSVLTAWYEVFKSTFRVCFGCCGRRQPKDDRISYVKGPNGQEYEILHSNAAKYTGATVTKEGSESTGYSPSTENFHQAQMSPQMSYHATPQPVPQSYQSTPRMTDSFDRDRIGYGDEKEARQTTSRANIIGPVNEPSPYLPQESIHSNRRTPSTRTAGSMSQGLHPSVIAAYNQRPLPDPPHPSGEQEIHEAPAQSSRAGTPMRNRREDEGLRTRVEAPTSANSYGDLRSASAQGSIVGQNNRGMRGSGDRMERGELPGSYQQQPRYI